MRIAIVGSRLRAGGRPTGLRRAMRLQRVGTIKSFRDKFIQWHDERGYDPASPRTASAD